MTHHHNYNSVSLPFALRLEEHFEKISHQTETGLESKCDRTYHTFVIISDNIGLYGICVRYFDVYVQLVI